MYIMLAFTYIFGLFIAITHALSIVTHDKLVLPTLVPSNRSMSSHTAVMFETKPTIGLLCNGVLIGRSTVLALATCVDPTKMDSLLIAMRGKTGDTLYASVEAMNHHPKFNKNTTYVQADYHSRNQDDDDSDLPLWNLAMLKLNHTLEAPVPFDYALHAFGQHLHISAWVGEDGEYDFEEYTHLTLPEFRCQEELTSCRDLAGQHFCVGLDRTPSDSDSGDGDDIDEFFGGPAFDSHGRLVGLYASEYEAGCGAKKDVIIMANVMNVVDWIRQHIV